MSEAFISVSRVLEIEIHPAPTDEERTAIVEALRASLDDGPRRSAWWRAGVEENVAPEVDPDG